MKLKSFFPRGIKKKFNLMVYYIKGKFFKHLMHNATQYYINFKWYYLKNRFKYFVLVNIFKCNARVSIKFNCLKVRKLKNNELIVKNVK